MKIKNSKLGNRNQRSPIRDNILSLNSHFLSLVILSIISYLSYLVIGCENAAFEAAEPAAPAEQPVIIDIDGLYSQPIEGVTLREALQSIKDKPVEFTNYIIDLAKLDRAGKVQFYLPPASTMPGSYIMENTASPTYLYYPGVRGIAITITNTGEEEKTITYEPTGPGMSYLDADKGLLFWVGPGIRLVLDGKVRLDGLTEGDVTDKDDNVIEGLGNDFVNNTAGLIYVESGALDIKGDVKITGNCDDTTGDNQFSAGIYINNKSELTMSGNAEICYNQAAESGGGIYAALESVITLSDYAKIHDNTSSSNGGGVYIINSELNLHDNASIYKNTGSGGGGIGAGAGTGSCVINMNDDTEVYENSGGVGGGVYLAGATSATAIPLSFYMGGNAKIRDNDSKANNGTYNMGGGGVYVSNFAEFVMDGNAEISGNTAVNESRGACGGGVLLFSTVSTFIPVFEMRGGVIQDNTVFSTSSIYYAEEYGGGVAVSPGTLSGSVVSPGVFTMSAGVIRNNTAGSENSKNYAFGSGVYVSSAANFLISGDAKITPSDLGYIGTMDCSNSLCIGVKTTNNTTDITPVIGRFGAGGTFTTYETIIFDIKEESGFISAIGYLCSKNLISKDASSGDITPLIERCQLRNFQDGKLTNDSTALFDPVPVNPAYSISTDDGTIGQLSASTQSTAPEFSSNTATSANQVDFTLSKYPLTGAWRIYTTESGDGILTYTVTSSGSTLSIKKSGSSKITAGTYYLTLLEDGKSESKRVEIIITEAT